VAVAVLRRLRVKLESVPWPHQSVTEVDPSRLHTVTVGSSPVVAVTVARRGRC
jgi:hypothetical protein